MRARVWLLSFVSIIVLVAIDGRQKTRQPRNEAALGFCSWLKDPQLKKCKEDPLLGLTARNGVELGLKQCRSQFTDRRWNCSGVTIADVFRRERMLKTNTRESSYLNAIAAAGVAYQITKGCSLGDWDVCNCASQPQKRGQKAGEASWEWGGCSEDFGFGSRYSKEFMDPDKNPEKDLSKFITQHNNEAGRKAIKDNMGKSCKCHGVSGSCTIRVCWKTMPKMAQVATELRRRFDSALKVKLNRSKTKLTRLSRGRRGRKRNTNNRRPSPSSLVYAVNSPDFCEVDDRYGVLGTVGRTCNKTSDGTDGCRQLCCGRGYNTANKVDDVKCNCTFIWCCHVKCDWCKKEWIEHTCKWGVMTSPIRNKLLWIIFKGLHGFLKYEISRLDFYFSIAVSDTVLGKQLWTITPETTTVSISFAVSTRIQRRLSISDTHVDLACGYCEAWLRSLFKRSSNVSLENRESKAFF